jgi:transposase
MSNSRTILPAPKLLNLIGIHAAENAITLAARTSSRVALCPVCAKRSVRVHSRYTRTLTDLPWQGIPVTVRLRVRRFFCDERTCGRAIFAERLPGVATRATAGEPSDSTAGSRTSPSPSGAKRALVC